MAETHVLSALKRKYARTLGALRATHGDRVRIMGDLNHLAAVIHMFNPDEPLEAIKPVRPHHARAGRWLRTTIAVLRKAERPLKARELARKVLLARGLDPGDHRLVVSVETTVQASLSKLADEGVVRITGKPRRWALVASQVAQAAKGEQARSPLETR